jgi:hypothetical protein
MPSDAYEGYDKETRAVAEAHDKEYGKYSFHEWTYSPGFRQEYKKRYGKSFPGVTPFEQQSAGQYLRKMDAKEAATRAMKRK